MVQEIFDDGEPLTPEQKALVQTFLTGTGVLKYVYKDGKVELETVPVDPLQHKAPKDTQ